MPTGIDYDESIWKELAIPHKEEISKNCASVESGAPEKLHYETCKMYDVDFEGLYKQHGGDLQLIKGKVQIELGNTVIVKI